MLTEDYIMRMLNQALAVLIKVIGLKQAGRRQEALQSIDQALEILFGLRADLIKRLDDESLLESLTSQETLDADRLLVAADLFKEQADILADLGRQAESQADYLRALNFYLEVILSGGPENLPDPSDKLEAVLPLLAGKNLPLETSYSLFSYYERSGRYSAAEQVLSRLVVAPGLAGEFRSEQIEFYDRLLAKSDQDLEKGGFSRARVREKLGSLRS